MAETKYVGLENLEVYQLARKLSHIAWDVYSTLDWKQRKIIGDQFLESTDSVGANIAEGYGRYHYLDKTKFYYNARGSLLESLHWLKLLVERNLVSNEKFLEEYQATYSKLSLKLNMLIRSNRIQKEK